MSIRRVYIGLGCLYSRSGRPKVSPEYRQTDRRTLYPCYIAYLGARSLQPNIASALPTAHREIYRSKNVADRNTRSTVLFRRLKFSVCASQQSTANRKRSTKRIRDARDAATVPRLFQENFVVIEARRACGGYAAVPAGSMGHNFATTLIKCL